MSARQTICCLVCLSMLTGCGRVVFRPDQQTAQAISLSPEQQQTLAQQQQQFQNRAAELDRDNQELESLLAQSRQESQLLREQVSATQAQLRATTDQLAGLQQERAQLQSKTQAMMASVKTPGPAGIRANNTLLRPLSVGSLPGVDVRQDGDTIRISIPADEVFQPGAAQLKPGGDQLLMRVAADVIAAYPEQVIGIEGHTDSAPPASPQFPTSHHLSVAQATTAYDLLTRGANVPAQQVFVIGHGGNHPRMSNATDAGRQANRRIEVVVYPEVVRRR